jgi:hypothetical protein
MPERANAAFPARKGRPPQRPDIEAAGTFARQYRSIGSIILIQESYDIDSVSDLSHALPRCVERGTPHGKGADDFMVFPLQTGGLQI